MKLSEAMRLGATLKPQTFHEFYSLDRSSSCAMGAACDAVGRDAMDFCWVDVWGIEISDALAMAACPACGARAGKRTDMIPHLNDTHRWTREHIADFIEVAERDLDEKRNLIREPVFSG